MRFAQMSERSVPWCSQAFLTPYATALSARAAIKQAIKSSKIPLITCQALSFRAVRRQAGMNLNSCCETANILPLIITYFSDRFSTFFYELPADLLLLSAGMTFLRQTGLFPLGYERPQEQALRRCCRSAGTIPQLS
jgi:hypothetical protein